MPAVSRPRHGSLQFVPKKRVSRLYPSISHWPKSDTAKILGFSAYKVGMTHALVVDTRKNAPTHGEEISIPVTVLDCPPLKVLAVRFYTLTPFGLKILSEVWDADAKNDKDLLRKMKPGKGTNFDNIERANDVRLLVRTQPRQSGIGKKTPEIFELGVGGSDVKQKIDFCKSVLGKEIKINDVFRDGEYIDIIAVTKGKGTQGVVKRWGVSIQNRKAGKKRRHIGTLGSQTPRRVTWTIPQAGQLGLFKRTEYNKRIIKIGEDGKDVTPKGGFNGYGIVKGSYVIIEGSVPGSRKRLILLRHPIRPLKIPFIPTEIRYLAK